MIQQLVVIQSLSLAIRDTDECFVANCQDLTICRGPDEPTATVCPIMESSGSKTLCQLKMSFEISKPDKGTTLDVFAEDVGMEDINPNELN